MSPPPTFELSLLTVQGDDRDPDECLNASDIIAIIDEKDTDPSPKDRRRAAVLQRAGNDLLWIYRKQWKNRNLAGAEGGDQNPVASDTISSTEPDFPDFDLSPEALARHFSHLSLPERMDKAIELLKRAADETAATDRWDKMHRLRDFGLALGARYKWTGAIDDINTAIKVHHQVLRLVTDKDEDIQRVTVFTDLAIALKTRLAHRDEELASGVASDEDLGDADTMATLFCAAAQMMDECDPLKATYLNNVGNALLWKFQHNPSAIQDLDSAVLAFGQAVAYTPMADMTRVFFLSELAGAAYERFEKTASEADLQSLEAAVREIVQMDATDTSLKVAYLTRLGNASQKLFDSTERIGDLDRGIRAFQDILVLSPEGEDGREIPLLSLGTAQFARYHTFGLPVDLEKAIDTLQQASRITTGDEKVLAEVMDMLDLALETQSKLTGNASSLDETVSLDETAEKSC